MRTARKSGLYDVQGETPWGAIGTLCRNPDRKFWSQVRVDADGCWMWIGSISCNKRGYYHDGKKIWQAARYAYFQFHGRIPAKVNGKRSCICHKCDKPLCCAHHDLFLGNDQINIHDAIRKGRFTHHRKLTPESVAVIRSERAAGVKRSALANRFGVTVHTIRGIDIGRVWSIPNLQPPGGA